MKVSAGASPLRLIFKGCRNCQSTRVDSSGALIIAAQFQQNRRVQSATPMTTTQVKVCIEIIRLEGVVELQHSNSFRIIFHPLGARAPSAQKCQTLGVVYQNGCAHCVPLVFAHQMPGSILILVIKFHFLSFCSHLANTAGFCTNEFSAKFILPKLAVRRCGPSWLAVVSWWDFGFQI